MSDETRTMLRVAMGFVGLVVGITFAASFMQAGCEGQSGPRESTPKLSAVTALQSVRLNSYAAGQSYDGKWCTVTGTVEGTLLSDLNQVIYLGPQVGDLTVWCYFRAADNARLARLQKGQIVSVKGRAEVSAGLFFLRKCTIAPKNP